MRAEAIQDRTRALMDRAEVAVVDLIHTVANARKQGAGDQELAKALHLHRKAEWRLDYVAAENSMGFHAPGEAARLLGEAIDFARQGQVETLKVISEDVGAVIKPPDEFQREEPQEIKEVPPIRPVRPPLVEEKQSDTERTKE